MNVYEQLNTYGMATVYCIEDLELTIVNLLCRKMSFKVLFDVDSSATLFLIEPEDQK